VEEQGRRRRSAGGVQGSGGALGGGGDALVDSLRSRSETQRKRETKRMGRAAPKPACRSSPTGVIHESRLTRWRDNAGPTTRHDSLGQTRVPPWRPQSRQHMWRDKVVVSRHPHWRDEKGQIVQIFFLV
jgi:hypothetical protein